MVTYQEHKITHQIVPFHVDETLDILYTGGFVLKPTVNNDFDFSITTQFVNNFLYALVATFSVSVGGNKYVRIWNLSSGDVIRTIPPESKPQNFPSAHISSGTASNASSLELLFAYDKKVHHYCV